MKLNPAGRFKCRCAAAAPDETRPPVSIGDAKDANFSRFGRSNVFTSAWVVAATSGNDLDARAILKTLTYFNNIAGAAQQRQLKSAQRQSAPVM